MTPRVIPWLPAIALCTSSAFAQEGVLRAGFARYDKNKNGTVEKSEYPGSAEQFALMDKNKDGKVTFAEFRTSPVARRILAYRRRDAAEPRERVTAKKLEPYRFAAIKKFDKNRDKKITKKEWTGAPSAFRELDLDGNGVIDKKDRALASKPPAPVDARIQEFKSKLPDKATLLKRFDKDKDGALSKTEVAKRAKLVKIFEFADTDRNKKLSGGELDALIGAVNSYVDARNRGGDGKPRALLIPFGSWDKNGDGRIDLKEWPEAHRYLFRRIDVNRDAGVTKNEVVRYKKSVEGTNFVEKHDLNGDGKVTFEEFGGDRAAFDRADRNGDGVISRRDR